MSNTVTTATNTVAKVVAPVSAATKDVVTKTTAPVVQAVDTAVTKVLQTTKSVTAPLPVVGGIVAPVVDTVSGVVDAVDLPGTVGGVTGVVDTTVGGVTGTVTGIVSAPGQIPGTPVIPGVPGAGGSDGGSPSPAGAGVANPVAAAAAEVTASVTTVAQQTIETLFRAARPAVAMTDAAATVALTLSPVDGAVRLAGDTSPALGASPGGSSAGSSGAGPGGAAALLAFGLFLAYRAWVRRHVLDDQQTPPAPVYDTDVAPD